MNFATLNRFTPLLRDVTSVTARPSPIIAASRFFLTGISRAYCLPPPDLLWSNVGIAPRSQNQSWNSGCSQPALSQTSQLDAAKTSSTSPTFEARFNPQYAPLPRMTLRLAPTGFGTVTRRGRGRSLSLSSGPTISRPVSRDSTEVCSGVGSVFRGGPVSLSASKYIHGICSQMESLPFIRSCNSGSQREARCGIHLPPK